MTKNKIHTLQDVRDWRTLKKDELELEKLKFHAEKDQVKTAIGKGLGKIFLYEGMILIGEKIITSVLKSLFTSTTKKKEKGSKKENTEE